MAITSMQAAKIACEASGWTLSNLQLHKILYLAHMVYSGDHDGEPLIGDERFQAWPYGPVLPSVYRYASTYGSSSIQNIFNHVPSVASDSSEYTTVTSAVSALGEMKPFELVSITHEPESAWAASYRPGARHVALEQEVILDEYRRRFE